ncbi:MAG: hypothetical protein HY914_17170 [Desulfomonile tiedjei]|nr:hypothetical protein [Desulfomonile tiedjei]
MKRVALVAVAAAALLWIAAPANAFLGTGLLPFGDFFGPRQGCAPYQSPCGLIAPPVVYVGWNDDRRGISFGGGNAAGLNGVARFEQQQRLRGVWLGVTQPLNLSENLTILGSGWYLFPEGIESTEIYVSTAGAQSYRTWTVTDEWWFVEGLAAIRTGFLSGFSLLAGVRYDYFYSKFSNPVAVGIPSSPSDEGNATSEAIIPLLGAQYAYGSPVSSLTVRVVGFPTVTGSFRARENFVAGVSPDDGSGNYDGGYFLEVFSEASRRIAGANIGAFVRWNAVHGKLPAFDVSAPGVSRTFDANLDRHSWTVGGTISIGF